MPQREQVLDRAQYGSTAICVIALVGLVIKLNFRVFNTPGDAWESKSARNPLKCKLVVSWQFINNCCAAFWCVVNFGLCGKIFREENSIDIYRDIRFLAALM